MGASTAGAVVAHGIKPDQWLATWTMPNAERPAATALESWTRHGLSADDLPGVRQDIHIFQSACASVRSRRGHSNGHDAKVEIAADEVQLTPNECVYQVTMRVWDLKEQTIEHEKALRVTFTRKTSAIGFDQLDSTDPRLRQIERDIRKHYRTNRDQQTITGEKIRNAIRALLMRHGAQNLRRKAGGLYFVPRETRDGAETRPMLDAIKAFLADLYASDADFYVMPFVLEGNPDLQEMVRKHFTLNANEELAELAAKAANRVRAGKGHRIRQELLTNLWNDRRRITGALEQLQELVGAEQADIEANLRMFDQSVEQLQQLAETE